LYQIADDLAKAISDWFGLFFRVGSSQSVGGRWVAAMDLRRATTLCTAKVLRDPTTSLNSPTISPPPITSVVEGIASIIQMSIFSAISMASSTSMPR
jgi:hypothetical protein